MSSVIDFEPQDDFLILVYSPDDTRWVQDKFRQGLTVPLKKTYHLGANDLDPAAVISTPEDPLRFRLGTLKGDYYEIDSRILDVSFPVLIHRRCHITWKWFTSARNVSIFNVIRKLEPSRIVIGGDTEDAIPETAFMKLLSQFPTDYELRRYTEARVAAVIRNYAETQKDSEALYHRYVERRITNEPALPKNEFVANDILKFQALHQKLEKILAAEVSFTESQWQLEILKIVCLLNPRYIQALGGVSIHDPDSRSGRRQVDILLVDVSGNVDIIEIKKPFGKGVLTGATYRDNHIPLRELSGSVMQVEKYIYYLNRWGAGGEAKLTEKYADRLPAGFKIKITNPTGIIIIGRDNNLTDNQRRDFEFVKRKYRSIVDIITYDDLLRRLKYVIDQLAGQQALIQP